MKFTRILDWIIITLGLLSTLLVTNYVSEKNIKEDTLRFEYETNFIIRQIQNRMQSYEAALIELRAFFLNSPDLSRNTIKNFIADTKLVERLPGIQGIGYTEMVRANELPQFLKSMQKSVPGFHIHPFAKRDMYSGIIILEPEDWRNKKAIGFDMYQEITRRQAMDEARDKNDPVMSEAIILVQEVMGSRTPGFNIYLPYYKKNADLGTVEGRRKGLLGFIYSPFRAQDLFKAIFQDLKMVLDVEIYGGEITPDKLFFDSSKDNDVDPTMQKITDIRINGRTLVIKTTPIREFGLSSSTLKTCVVFIIGTIITFLVYFIYFMTRRQMNIVSIMAEEKEKLLQTEKEHVSARDDFLSIASHELKTPLTSLKLQSQLMLRSIQKNDTEVFNPEKVTSLVRLIDTQTTRLTRLVDDMLDISRIRTGRLKMIKESVELTEVILDVTERLKPQFLQVIGEAPILELQENIRGEWDRFRLEQILTNLFTNAIRYGNKKPITVKTTVENRCAKICVIDQGIGVAKENKDKIFERFERAGMSLNEVSGLGLGLFITNQIIKAHGGSIRVESEPGKGSTFIVELPLSV